MSSWVLVRFVSAEPQQGLQTYKISVNCFFKLSSKEHFFFNLENRHRIFFKVKLDETLKFIPNVSFAFWESGK